MRVLYVRRLLLLDNPIFHQPSVIDPFQFDLHQFNVVKSFSDINDDSNFSEIVEHRTGFSCAYSIKSFKYFQDGPCFIYRKNLPQKEPPKQGRLVCLVSDYKPGACPNSAAIIQICFSNSAFAPTKISLVTSSPSASVISKAF